MAITIKVEPQEIQPAYNEVTVVLDSTNKAEPKFQYVVDINVGGVYSSRIKVQSNPQGYGVMNLSKHLESYVSSDVDFNTLDVEPIEQLKDLVFDEIADSINLGDSTALGGNSSVSIQMGVNFKTSTGNLGVLFKSGEVNFKYNYTTNELEVDLVVTTGTAVIAIPMDLNTDYEVNVAYENDILYGYLDNVLIDSDSTKSGAIINSGSDMLVGYNLVDNSAFMDIAYLKVYDNSLRGHLDIFKDIPNSFTDYDVTLSEEYVLTTSFTTVTDNGGFTQYNYATDHNFSVDDFTTVSSSSVPAYDGIQEITAVPSSTAIVTTEVYSATATGDTVLSNGTVTIIADAAVFTGNKYILNNVLKWRDVRGWRADDYEIGAINRGKLLTNLPSTMVTKLDDRFTVNYFNEAKAASTTFLKVFTSDGDTYYFENLTSAEQFKSVGVGAYDVANGILYGGFASSVPPVIKTTTTSYTAELVDIVADTVSEVLTFEIDRSCQSNYKLMYLNNEGSFTTFNFDLVHSKNVNAKKTNYKKNYGAYDSTANTYGWSDSARGETRLDTDITETYTINSDYVKEAYGNLIEDLILSPEVYHLDNNVLRSIDINTSSVKIKQRAVEKLINYTIQFEYSSKNTVQR